MDANFIVAQNLRRLRIKAGLSQEALAHEAGVDRTYVSRIERKMENCTVTVLERLAAAIGCGIVDFFARIEGEEPAPLKVGRKTKRKPK